MSMISSVSYYCPLCVPVHSRLWRGHPDPQFQCESPCTVQCNTSHRWVGGPDLSSIHYGQEFDRKVMVDFGIPLPLFLPFPPSSPLLLPSPTFSLLHLSLPPHPPTTPLSPPSPTSPYSSLFLTCPAFTEWWGQRVVELRSPGKHTVPGGRVPGCLGSQWID